MNFDALLAKMVEMKASDLFITAGKPPCVKAHGKVTNLSDTVLTPDKSMEIVLGLMDEKQRDEFLVKKENNFAIQAEGLGRFRVSAFYQRSNVGAVLRRIESEIPALEDLGVPQAINEFSMIKRGLVILVGATGAGKSSTLAAMIGYRNRNSTGHIITIEDPIEFVHDHDGCIITQREVGIDTDSFEVALKNTLRQAPDIILVGEIRSQDTMEYAINFAETGHLCLATLHANNANQALDRIVNFFPPDKQRQLWMDLSLNLKAIVAQQLIPKAKGTGRVPAVEILINTPIISEYIKKAEVDALKEFMAKGRELGMQTFDQALFDLYESGLITYEEALRNAESVNDLRLKIKLNSKHKQPEQEKSSFHNLDLV